MSTPIIEKIQKLLALSQSDNEHEAALAAARAQDLMLKHDLQMADVEAAAPSTRAKVTEEQAKVAPKLSRWEASLFGTVAQTSFCAAYIRNVPRGVKSNGSTMYEHRLTFVGKPGDIEMAGYIYSFLVGELKRLAELYSRTVRTNGQRGVLKHKRESWLLGAAAAVQSTLRQQFAERTSGGAANALVRVKDADVKEYMDSEVPNLKRAYRQARDVDSDAYWTGHQTGKTIGVRPGVGAATRPAARLEG